ncbi:hypothetical protein Tco_0090586 [Tanacetum coccineum]
MSQDSPPHAQSTKDKCMMKALVHVSKSFAISNVQALPQKNIIDKIFSHVIFDGYLHVVYSDSEPWRFQWVSDDEPEAPEEVLQFTKQAPPSPDYVPGPEHPPSPDYVPGPEHLPLPDYVPGPKYPEYLVPSIDEVPIEDQPLPADASPTTLSPGYVADSDPSEEDPEEEPTEYPTNGGDDDDDDDDDIDDKEDEEVEEHLALADFTTLHATSQGYDICLTSMSAATEALIAAVAAALPSSPPPSLLTPLSSPFPHIPSPPLPLPSPPTYTSPTYAEAPLGYRAAMIWSSATSPLPLLVPSPPLLLPSTAHRDDITEEDMPLQRGNTFA